MSSLLKSFAPEQLRNAFAAYPTGVAVVSALSDTGPIGMTVSSFLSVSLDPPLVSISVARSSTTWPVLRTAPLVGLSILAEDQEHISRQLSSRDADRFRRVGWEETEGAVFIPGAVLRLLCSVEDHLPAGDHELVLLRIRDMQLREDTGRPLVFHGSSYRRLEAS